MSSQPSLLVLGALVGLLGAFFAGAILAPFSAPISVAAEPSARERMEAPGEARGAALASPGGRLVRRDEPAPDLPAGELGEERLRALSRELGGATEHDPRRTAIEASVETFLIEGRVATVDGLPVEGAEVRTIPAGLRFASWEAEFLERPADGRPEERSLEAALRAAARRHAEIRRDLRSAKSDARGQFRIEGVRAGIEHSLEAFCAGYEIQGTDGTPFLGVQPGQSVQLLAKPLVRLPLRIEEGDGTPLDVAIVQVENTGHGWSMPRAWNRAEGAIFLSAGQYRISATHLPTRGRTTKPLSIEVVASAPPQELLLRFEVLARLEVRVAGKLLAGAERRGVQVRVAAHENGRAPDREQMRWNGRFAEPSGKELPALFVARDLPPGAHSVAVLLGEERVLALRTVEIGAGANAVDIELEETSGDRIVEVAVADPQGRGIPDLQLWVRREAEDDVENDGVEIVPADDEGARWRIVHEAARLTTGVTWRLQANSPRHGQILREYDPRTAGTIELRFAEGARLEVLVPNASGAQVALEAAEPLGTSKPTEEFAQSELDEGGRALLGPFAPGRYVVRLDQRFQGWSTLPLLRREIELTPGPNRLELALPPLYAVRVSAPGSADRGGRVMLRYRSLEGREERTGIGLENEQAELTNLPAGRYELSLRLSKEPEPRRVEFSLPGATEAVLAEPSASAAAPGVALPELEAGSLATRFGLRSGDVLVGIAGRKLDDPRTAWAILRAAPHLLEGESYAVELLRGGQRLELNLPRELFLDPDASGLRGARRRND
jgi:hypothetical protein